MRPRLCQLRRRLIEAESTLSIHSALFCSASLDNTISCDRVCQTPEMIGDCLPGMRTSNIGVGNCAELPVAADHVPVSDALVHLDSHPPVSEEVRSEYLGVHCTLEPPEAIAEQVDEKQISEAATDCFVENLDPSPNCRPEDASVLFVFVPAQAMAAVCQYATRIRLQVRRATRSTLAPDPDCTWLPVPIGLDQHDASKLATLPGILE